MVETASASFAELLKQYRAAAGLTQEELAERANLSARAISDLERGIKHRPYAHTVQRLVQALGITTEEASQFERTARRLGVVGEGPEPAHRAVSTSTLPIQPTPFIGRQREVGDMTQLLHQQDVRLLTLTGPGGVGKSRLALRVAEEMVARFPDGVVFVSLASVADPGLVPSAMATALEVTEGRGQSLLDALIDHLRSQQLLLLLDNFEHLLPAADVVSGLLVTCPQLTILVTSRAILHLAAEHEYPVPPLPVPTPLHLPELDALSRYDAIQLFVQRGRAVKPGFELTDENASAVAEICYRLDGLPLAIELAAARTRLFPAQVLLAHLSDRLQLLTGGPRDQPVRQQTLRNTIDWSYRLLTPDEQRLFARLSVFVGGCSFEAAEAVWKQDGNLDVLAGISSLVEQSLLREAGDDEPRFQMLETIREYASERLKDSGEAEQIQQRHAEYCLLVVTEPGPRLLETEQAESLERLEREHDNLRAALRWALDRGESDVALRLVAALWGFWFLRGHLTEGRAAVEAALALPSSDASARASVLLGAGLLTESRARHVEGLTLYRKLGDKQGIAAALNRLGWQAIVERDLETATVCFEESLALERELNRPVGMAGSVHPLGVVALLQGEYQRAARLLDESLTYYRGQGNKAGMARVLHMLGGIAEEQGDYDRATALCEEALIHARELGSKKLTINPLANLGRAAAIRKDFQRARSLCLEALALACQMGERYEIAVALEGLAMVAGGTGWPERAGRLWGAAEALRLGSGPPSEPGDRRDPKRLLAVARHQLDEAAWNQALNEVQAMTLEQAIEYAQGEDGDGKPEEAHRG